MKNWLLALALIFASILPASASKASEAVDANVQLRAEQHAAAVTIITQKDGEAHGAGCSASAIAPHVLLTSAHCRVDDGKVYLNQVDRPFNHPLYVEDRFFDGADHMLLVLPDVTFKHFVVYDPDNFKEITSLEHYYFWGNPGMIPDQYREGYVTGFYTPKDDHEVMLSQKFSIVSGPVVGGDSGSSIFAEDGRIVGTLTWGVHGGLFSGFYPLAFTKAQVLQAEGLGSFVYAPRDRQTVVVVSAPVKVVNHQDKSMKVLTILAAILLLMYSRSFIYNVGGHVGRGAKHVLRIRVRLK